MASTPSVAGSGTEFVPPLPPGAGGHHDGTTLQVAPALAGSLPSATTPSATSNAQNMFLTRTPHEP